MNQCVIVILYMVVPESVKTVASGQNPLSATQSQLQHSSQTSDMIVKSENVGPGKLEHLGKIADIMDEWEGSIANELGLSPANVANIKRKHPFDLKLQV